MRACLHTLVTFELLHPGFMPSARTLRRYGRADLVTAITSLGGFLRVATDLHLIPGRSRRNHCRGTSVYHAPVLHTLSRVQFSTILQLQPTSEPRLRKHNHYWYDWRNLQSELHQFAETHCAGHMPLRRELITASRTDLVNAIRIHGGFSHVARRAALSPPPCINNKRPKGYWSDPAVLHAELLTFTAKNGHPGLMPRRDQLMKAGRADIAYAVEKYGGYSAVAADIHLVWHGPCSFWRDFRHVQKRLLTFVNNNHLAGVMPSVQLLQSYGRMDLVYGIALHGGVMHVADKVGLDVVYPKHAPEFWQNPANVKKELQAFMLTQPLEARQCMPSSVALVQAGRADLATVVRDHGGWVYYAQMLGLRFAFEVRRQGFWQRESNVVVELRNYVERRYGFWGHPGALNSGERVEQSEGDSGKKKVKRKRLERSAKCKGTMPYVPSSEMLKRDGRSDIAFAIERYHGGMPAFAERHSFRVAEDTVQIKPQEVLMRWEKFANEMNCWIQTHGTNGIMPTKQDLIVTGRHDLRFSIYKHGGEKTVAQRLQLVCAGTPLDIWLPQWLGQHAGKLGLLLSTPVTEGTRGKTNLARRQARELERQLDGSAIGAYRKLVTRSDGGVVHSEIERRNGRKRIKSAMRRRLKERKKVIESEKMKTSNRMSAKELERLRKRYQHLASDDIIEV